MGSWKISLPALVVGTREYNARTVMATDTFIVISAAPMEKDHRDLAMAGLKIRRRRPHSHLLRPHHQQLAVVRVRMPAMETQATAMAAHAPPLPAVADLQVVPGAAPARANPVAVARAAVARAEEVQEREAPAAVRVGLRNVPRLRNALLSPMFLPESGMPPSKSSENSSQKQTRAPKLVQHSKNYS